MQEEEKTPGTHCLHMHQVALVTCILFRYTKITDNSRLPAGRPQRRNVSLKNPTGGFEAKNYIASTVTVSIVSFKAVGGGRVREVIHKLGIQ